MANELASDIQHNHTQFLADLEKCLHKLHKEQVSQVYDSILWNNKHWIRGLERRRKFTYQGTYADIYQATYKGREVCDKELRIFGSSSSREDLLKLHVNEIVVWSQLEHQNILSFFGIYINEARICLVSPWMKNGNLKVYSPRQPYHVKIQLLLDVAKGLEYLHSKGIVHRDLKAENILISDNGHALIGDFGLSSDTSKTYFPSSCGTLGWMAPEVLAGIEISGIEDRKSSDIWSFGCLVYEVMEGKRPYANRSIFQAQMIKRQTPGETHDPCLKNLVQSCWDFDPAQRPSVTAVRCQMEDLYLSTLP